MPKQATLYATLDPSTGQVVFSTKRDPSKTSTRIVLTVVPAKNGKYLRINGVNMSADGKLISAIERGDVEEVLSSFMRYNGRSIIVKNGFIQPGRPKNMVTKKDILDGIKIDLLAETYKTTDESSEKMAAFNLPDGAEIRSIQSISKSTLNQLKEGKIAPLGYATYESVFGPEVVVYYGNGSGKIWGVHLGSSYEEGERFLESLPTNEPFGNTKPTLSSEEISAAIKRVVGFGNELEFVPIPMDLVPEEIRRLDQSIGKKFASTEESEGRRIRE